MLDGHSLEVLRLWSLGVGSVIGGDFFGWNSCLKGGFGAGLLSMLWAGILYFVLARCVARLCKILPTAKGSYSIVAAGLGPHQGAIVAACETLKLFWVLMALGFGIVEYFLAIVDEAHSLQYVVYLLLVVSFCVLGSFGIKSLGNSQIIVTFSCLVVLVFYWTSVISNVNFKKYATPNNDWFHRSDKVLESLPFGAWFFLGFEEIPLLLPPGLEGASKSFVLKRGMLFSFLTVLTSCILTLILASSSSPGVNELKSEEAPLVEGIKGVYGEHSIVVTLFAVSSVLALLAPFCSFFLYCAYHLQEISEAGMIPHQLAELNSRHVPSMSLFVVSISTFVLLSVFALIFGIAESAEVVIPGCLLSALVSAFLQLEALIKVQRIVASDCTDDSLLLLDSKSSKKQFHIPTDSKEISIYEIRLGQGIIAFILACIFILACRNQSHRIGLSIAASFLLALTWIMYRRVSPITSELDLSGDHAS